MKKRDSLLNKTAGIADKTENPYICSVNERGDKVVPSFHSQTIENDMIETNSVRQIAEEGIAGSDLFVVEVSVSPDNRIVVEIDNDGGVDIEQCERLHRFIESRLDRDTEDYELEVGSSGLTAPFKIARQYVKNIGNEVEVLTRSGVKLSGILKAADDEKFVVTVTKKVKPEGAKRKIEVEEDLTYIYNEVKYTKYLIRFK